MSLNSEKKREDSGFTLIEILIAIVVIGATAGTILVAVDPAQRFADARNSRRSAETLAILSAIKKYEADTFSTPAGIDSTLRVLGTDGSGCDAVCGIGGSFEIDDDTGGEFGSGTFSSTQWDAGNAWVELTAGGQAGGSGTFTSTVTDSTIPGSTWSNLSWVPQRPTGKQLPNNATSETAYNTGNANMSGNVLLMHMNESSWNGTSNEALDNSGNANHGTAGGDATTTTSGRFNSGGAFDGTGDYVLISDDASLEFSNQLTLAGWFYFDTDIGSKRLIEKGSGTTSNFEYRILTLDDGVFGFQDSIFMQLSANGSAASLQTFQSSGLASYKDQWVHIAGTYDGSTARLYINGSEVSSASGSITLHNGNGDLGIGSDSLGAFTFGPGRMDEIAIFSRALGVTELEDMYKRGAIRLRQQVRSCDDAACSGETFIGPDGTASTFYEHGTDPSLATPTFAITNLDENQYFQYRSTFITDDSSLTPELKSLTVDYTTPGELTATACLDLSSDLVPTYLASIPQDPDTGTAANTGYAVKRTGSIVQVSSCGAESNEAINVRR